MPSLLGTGPEEHYKSLKTVNQSLIGMLKTDNLLSGYPFIG